MRSVKPSILLISVTFTFVVLGASIDYASPGTQSQEAASGVRAVPACVRTVGERIKTGPQRFDFDRLEQLGNQINSSLVLGRTDAQAAIRAHRAGLAVLFGALNGMSAGRDDAGRPSDGGVNEVTQVLRPDPRYGTALEFDIRQNDVRSYLQTIKDEAESCIAAAPAGSRTARQAQLRSLLVASDWPELGYSVGYADRTKTQSRYAVAREGDPDNPATLRFVDPDLSIQLIAEALQTLDRKVKAAPSDTTPQLQALRLRIQRAEAYAVAGRSSDAAREAHTTAIQLFAAARSEPSVIGIIYLCAEALKDWDYGSELAGEGNANRQNSWAYFHRLLEPVRAERSQANAALAVDAKSAQATLNALVTKLEQLLTSDPTNRVLRDNLSYARQQALYAFAVVSNGAPAVPARRVTPREALANASRDMVGTWKGTSKIAGNARPADVLLVLDQAALASALTHGADSSENPPRVPIGRIDVTQYVPGSGSAISCRAQVLYRGYTQQSGNHMKQAVSLAPLGTAPLVGINCWLEGFHDIEVFVQRDGTPAIQITHASGAGMGVLQRQ